LVIRLNKKGYHEQDFTNVGIQHLEQIYLDGSCPPMTILQHVLHAMEQVTKPIGSQLSLSTPASNSENTGAAFAIHCKAGLGRTGTCIGAYLMKHYRFTAPQAIGWMRICRPGCVIGPQQHFLQELEHIMWQQGDLYRATPAASSIRNNNNNNNSKSLLGRFKNTTTPNDNHKSKETEAVSGRAGQADALLARLRHRAPSQGLTAATATASATIAMEPPMSPKRGTTGNTTKPVPVTPDSSSSNSSTTAAESGASATTTTSASSPSSPRRWLTST
jgi:cell division cycle 14